MIVVGVVVGVVCGGWLWCCGVAGVTSDLWVLVALIADATHHLRPSVVLQQLLLLLLVWCAVMSTTGTLLTASTRNEELWHSVVLESVVVV